MIDQTRGEAWIPLIEVGAGGWIGVTRDGAWMVGAAGRCVALRTGVPLLPLLEESVEAVDARLRNALTGAGLPPEVADGFPWSLAVEAGLGGGSSYWAERALAWLDAIPPTASTATLLRSVAEATWATQSVRHRARRTLRVLGGRLE